MRSSYWSSDVCSSDRVEGAEPPVGQEALGRALGAGLGANVVFLLDQRAGMLGRAVTEADVEPVTWWLYRQGKGVSGVELQRADHEFHRAGQAMAAFHQTYDVLLSPTVAQPPLPLGTINLVTDDIDARSEEHTSELQSLMRISYAVFCLKKKNNTT